MESIEERLGKRRDKYRVPSGSRGKGTVNSLAKIRAG